MPSILPDFEYDIFISYRQNDNKRDKWVTHFVEALKDELEATLKNPVSIYFDENPHDGLLETHDVDKSLEKKLKCLVLIPIISQTYCDPSCFAWEHEFLPFVEMAKKDELGMNITLANGNVASRVLPIRIHDIDSDDTALFEQAVEGRLRSIDFIYKEPGVNRPITVTDDQIRKSGKVLYSDQINKVANALKEIGVAILRNTGDDAKVDTNVSPISEKQSIPKRNYQKIMLLGTMAVLVLLAAVYFASSSTIDHSDNQLKIEKSIAVLPFRNDSNDPSNIYFCNGLMEDIINQLAQIPDMRVPSATSMLYYRDNQKPYEEIIKELNVSYLLEASVRKMANKALMNITLIDAAKNEQIWSDRLEMDLSVKELFDVQFEVANAVASKMRIAMTDNKAVIPTNNYEAYDNFTKARDLMKLWDNDKNRTAIDLLLAATKLDSKFVNAFVLLGQAYGQRAELSDAGYWVDSARVYSTIAYNMNSQDAGAICALAYAYALNGQTYKALELYLEANEINPSTPYNYAGWCYHQLGENDKAILWAKKNIENDPKNSIFYIDMSNAATSLGLFDESILYTNKAFEINPFHSFAFDNFYKIELYRGNYLKALEALQQAARNGGSSEYESSQGIIYYKMDSLEKAYAKLNGFSREKFNESTGDENSIIQLYEFMQYKGLVLIKLGKGQEGRNVLFEAIRSIEQYVSNERPQKYFLLAGCYAVLGDNEKSLAYLAQILDSGYNNYYGIITSAAFDTIHGNERYEAIIAEIKSRNDEMRDRVLKEGVFN